MTPRKVRLPARATALVPTRRELFPQHGLAQPGSQRRRGLLLGLAPEPGLELRFQLVEDPAHGRGSRLARFLRFVHGREPREPVGYPDRVGCRLQRGAGVSRPGLWVVAVVRPGVWQPPVAPSRLEQEVMKRVKRARLFVWLREHRHELFDEDLQAELAEMYQDKPVGQPPVPPAQIGLATILQAYT